MIKISEVTVKSYISPSKLPETDYVINPYTGCPHKCIYCYGEFMKRFTKHAGDEWGDFLDVKICEKKMNYEKFAGSKILFGSVTDAYNPYERKYGVTRSILKKLQNSYAKIEILTKSNLVTRDIDILKNMKNLRVGLSMNSLNNPFIRQTEPRAPIVAKRIEALWQLKAAGIDTYLFMSPIFPGITEWKEIIKTAMPCANAFYFENLNLRAVYKPRVFKYISGNFNHLIPLYEEIYKRKNNEYWEELRSKIESFCKEQELNYKFYFHHEKIKKGGKKTV